MRESPVGKWGCGGKRIPNQGCNLDGTHPKKRIMFPGVGDSSGVCGVGGIMVGSDMGMVVAMWGLCRFGSVRAVMAWWDVVRSWRCDWRVSMSGISGG